MSGYTPAAHEHDAHQWARRQPAGSDARRAADDLEVAVSAYDETRAEAGRYGAYCEFTQQRLGLIAAEERQAYARMLALWARGYTRGDNT